MDIPEPRTADDLLKDPEAIEQVKKGPVLRSVKTDTDVGTVDKNYGSSRQCHHYRS